MGKVIYRDNQHFEKSNYYQCFSYYPADLLRNVYYFYFKKYIN